MTTLSDAGSNFQFGSRKKRQRLNWYQSMLARPSHPTVNLATLFGSFQWERVADFELKGSLSHRVLPALRQLADELTRFLLSWLGFVWAGADFPGA